MHKEKWQEIENFPGYMISSFGRVKSPRKILKPVLHVQGYLYVTLCIGGKRSGKRINRLVATAFLPNPLKLSDVCHKDGNPANNHIDNLRWDSRKGNMKDCLIHGTHNRGENHGMSKLTSFQIQEIKALVAGGTLTQKEIATQFNITQTAVSLIKLGKRWNY